MSEQNEKLKSTFGSISELYDEVRPSYPREVVALTCNRLQNQETYSIFEIGAGTGQATELFASEGHMITATDLSQELLNKAQKRLHKYTNITYVSGSFETLNITSEMYDIVISAQAFHWIDPHIGLRKTHDILKSNGVLALFWNFINFEETRFLEEIKDILIACAPAFQGWPDASTARFEGFLNYWHEQILLSIHFTQPQVEVLSSHVAYTRNAFQKLIETFSWFQTLEEQNKQNLREQLSEKLRGDMTKINVPVRTIVITGVKVAT